MICWIPNNTRNCSKLSWRPPDSNSRGIFDIFSIFTWWLSSASDNACTTRKEIREWLFVSSLTNWPTEEKAITRTNTGLHLKWVKQQKILGNKRLVVYQSYQGSNRINWSYTINTKCIVEVSHVSWKKFPTENFDTIFERIGATWLLVSNIINRNWNLNYLSVLINWGIRVKILIRK